MYGLRWWSNFFLSFFFFPCNIPVLPTLFVEEAVLLHCMLLPPLLNIVDHRDMGLFVGSLYSVSLIYVSVLMPMPDCFDYSGLVIQFDIRYCDPSCFVLSQNCCSYSGSFIVPYEFLKCLFYICEICHGYFNRDCIESIFNEFYIIESGHALGSMAILMMLILSIHEHDTCFHLFVSSLISFVVVV